MIKKHYLFLLFGLGILFGTKNSIISQSNTNNNKEKRLPLTQIWEKTINNRWKKYEIFEFKYDSNNNLIQELTKTVNGNNKILKSRVLRYYNEDKNMIKRTRELWKDNGWNFAMQSSYVYSSKKIIRRVDSIANKNRTTLIFTEYAYDKNGKLLTETSQKIINGEKYNHFKTKHYYNNDGLVVKKEFLNWQNDKWVNKRKMILVYNAYGFHTRTIRFNWIDPDWVESIDYKLKVDKYGNRLSELWKRFNSEGIKESYIKVTYNYD